MKFIEVVNKTLKLASAPDLTHVPSGNCLIKVAYAGVNRPDVLQRKGTNLVINKLMTKDNIHLHQAQVT